RAEFVHESLVRGQVFGQPSTEFVDLSQLALPHPLDQLQHGRHVTVEVNHLHVKMLALRQNDEAAILSEVGPGRLLEHERRTALQGTARPAQVFMDSALHNLAIESLSQQLSGAVKDAEIGNPRAPLLAAVCDDSRVRIVKADQRKLV